MSEINEYRRNIKQYRGVEAYRARIEKSQRAHIQLAIRAFIRMERIRAMKEISFFEQRMTTGRKAGYRKMKETRIRNCEYSNFLGKNTE